MNWIARINRAMTRIVVRASFPVRHCEARRDEAIQIVGTNLGSWIATGINALAMTENQRMLREDDKLWAMSVNSAHRDDTCRMKMGAADKLRVSA